MTTRLGIVTDPAAGGTFLDWSIHYLHGSGEYYNGATNTIYKVLDNPLTAINAHLHKPTMPLEFSMCADIFRNFNNSKSNLLTCYTHYSKSIEESKKIFQWLNQNSKKLIISSSFEKPNLFNNTIKSRITTDNTPHDRLLDFLKYFFNDSISAWKNLNLLCPWELREFIALNIRPFEQTNIYKFVDLNISHYRLSTDDLYNNLDKIIPVIFDYLEISIDHDRWPNWLRVYNQWKDMLTPRINWDKEFDNIVNSIIGDIDMDISEFNLDILQEATLQHQLIYKHGLTIKGYGISKLPTNTKDIHKLLEPNFHNLVKY